MTLVTRNACPRASCDASALAGPVRAAVRGIERRAPISAVQTMTSVVATATADRRFYLVLLGAFAAIAVILASVGIFGVTSYSVARRTHEIGLRIALGADPSSVLASILRSSMMLAGTGAGFGVTIALVLTRSMRTILYGVGPTDPLTFGAVTGLLLLVGAAASYIPGRRATRIDPVVALRRD
jgi:putative ABC transport system permease protein